MNRFVMVANVFNALKIPIVQQAFAILQAMFVSIADKIPTVL
jgi:hypothetical protein